MSLTKTQKWLIAAALSSILMVVLGGMVFFKAVSDPSVPLLLSHKKAKWVLHDEPFDLVAKNPEEVVTSFRKFFRVDSDPGQAELTVYAMKSAAVFLDGQPVNRPEEDFNNWKKPKVMDLGRIAQGEHEIRINVLNRNSPAILLAYSEALDLYTGSDWQASRDKETWSSAREADRSKPPVISAKFPKPIKALTSVLPYLIPVFAIVFVWTAGHTRGRIRWVPSASMIRWLVLVAWVVLAANNIWKLQTDAGFDIEDHLQYIRYVAENLRIPLPTEGWQMFQSPLYYIVSAPVYLFSRAFFGIGNAELLLRVVPLLCGIAQIELTYRTLRYVYPEKESVQALGTVIGGLLPVNIYISQYAGNEPMAGLFTSAALMALFGIIHKGGEWPIKRISILGIFFGLALLSKITPILLIPPLVFMLACALSSKGAKPSRVVSGIVIFLAIAFLVSGWYYIRNWVEVGRPFIGGWDDSRGIVWWQDPGYRTIGQFFTFGEALSRPIYSSYNGFWDGFYSSFWLDGYLSALNDYSWRPAWNYDFVIAGALLALLPSAAIIVGTVSALFRPEKSLRSGELFAISCIAVYFGAILYLFLKVPIYSTVKASYTLGLIPCYAILCAAGLDKLTKTNLLRASIYGLVAVWAVSAYFAYFIIQ